MNDAYSRLAPYYDNIYTNKDYGADCERLREIISGRLGTQSLTLLDVACGTGRHVAYLQQWFEVQGLDYSEELLAVARARCPHVPFHHGDMMDFELSEAFDVVTCLFSSIGYTRTVEGMQRAIESMGRHVKQGGLLIVEPWITPEAWHSGSIHALLHEEEDLKIARMHTSQQKGRLSILHCHYLVGRPDGTEHVEERHLLGLFSTEETSEAFTRQGFEVEHDPEGLTGRGLFIGRKQPPSNLNAEE